MWQAKRFFGIVGAAVPLVLGACGSQREPAQVMLHDIAAALVIAGPDAVRYEPEQVHDVQLKLAALGQSFDQGHYAEVVRDGPAVLAEAQGLAAGAAATKATVERGLGEQWTQLSATVTTEIAAIEKRLAVPQKATGARGLDLEAARSGFAQATSLWSKALGAFGNNNLDEAVSTAREVKTRLAAVAASLKLELADPPPAGSANSTAPSRGARPTAEH